MNIDDNIYKHAQAHLDGGTYSLDRIAAFLMLIGNPQDSYRVVHVAGTSGKTSTSYYSAALLHAAGKKVGLTTSPHFASVKERTQINMRLLDDELYARELNEFLKLVSLHDAKLSYFELLTAFSYWEFQRQAVDVAVIEVGLGGLLDATNVISRHDKVCIITDIGFDHVEILGKTLAEIAGQKAGIIHENNQVYINQQTPEVMDVIQDVCIQKNASFSVCDTDLQDIEEFALPLFQKRNLRLAAFACGSLVGQITTEMLEPAAATTIPGRMQVYEEHGQTVILDGSHNAQKLEALVHSVQDAYPDEQITLVVSFAKKKEQYLDDNLAVLRTLSDTIIITEFAGEQDYINESIDPNLMVTAARQAQFRNVSFIRDPQDAVHAAIKTAPIVVVTGSFYLLNHVHVLSLDMKGY